MMEVKKKQGGIPSKSINSKGSTKKKAKPTSIVPNVYSYEKHRQRFGAAPYDHADNIAMHKLARKITNWRKKNKSDEDIPYNWAAFKRGTQYITVRLWYAHDDVNTTSGQAVLDVFQIQLAEFLNQADFTGAFDEFRPIGGEMQLHSVADSNTTSGATAARYLGTGVAVIDYGDAAALATFDNGISFDTKKFFNLFHSPDSTANKFVRLPVWLEPLPDQDWLSVTSGTTVNFAWMKLYVEANHVVPTANEVAFVTGWMDFQWRQTSGA